MLQYLSKEVKVIVDRPLCSRHPEYEDLYYTLNYGYVPNTVAPDGEELDAYIVGEFEPLKEFTGIVIAIVHRKNDVEDKLIVAKNPNKYNRDQLQALVEFQERFFDVEIITC
ncbi:MAG: inorganic diphosphatase [Bacillota bacterium]